MFSWIWTRIFWLCAPEHKCGCKYMPGILANGRNKYIRIHKEEGGEISALLKQAFVENCAQSQICVQKVLCSRLEKKVPTYTHACIFISYYKSTFSKLLCKGYLFGKLGSNLLSGCLAFIRAISTRDRYGIAISRYWRAGRSTFM